MDNVPLAGHGAAPHYKSIGDTALFVPHKFVEKYLVQS